MFSKLLLLVFTAGAAAAARLPGVFSNDTYHAGLLPVADKGEMFHWLWGSRSATPESDPLVIWLTGGPGCSSELAALVENGPYRVNEDGTSLLYNQFGWNGGAHLLYVDQPLGTGFSIAKGAHYVVNEKQVAADFISFLDSFVDRYPQFEGRDLFVTGESYAGHYVPAISAALLSYQKLALKGAAIGNGWVDPVTQYPAYAPFAAENGLLPAANITEKALAAALDVCVGLVKTGVWPVALEACQITVEGIWLDRFNIYDIRKKCLDPPLCYNFSRVDTFVKNQGVRAALNVSKDQEHGHKWKDCNMLVHTLMLGDWMKSVTGDVVSLLEAKVPVLVYSGDKDYICNWRGGQAWTNALQWSGGAAFRETKLTPWGRDQGDGWVQSSGGLTFLRVKDAGHMVPMDQPRVASVFISSLLKGGKF